MSVHGPGPLAFARGAPTTTLATIVALAWLVGCGGGEAPQATRCRPGEEPPVNCNRGAATSPFTCVRFTKDCRVDVRLATDGPWYRLAGINGVTADGVVALAKRACPEAWKKRIAEDLPALMTGVCAPFDGTARLLLRDIATGAVHEESAGITAENRARTKGCWPKVDECRS